MSIQRNDTRDKVWAYLKRLIGNDYGVAGMMGNLYSESAIDPTTAEGLMCQRYSEDGDAAYKRPVNTAENRAANNALYTSRVDSGRYPKSEFLSPRGKHYGYGFAQWTTEVRKGRLWANTKDKGLSIGDIDGQLETLRAELQGTFINVLNQLKSAKSIDIASDVVLTKFEQPPQADKLKATRRSYSKEIYNLYHTGETTMGYDVNKLIGVATNEIGYLEKKSNSNLDSKTANAGSNNYTKYWRDLKPSYQGQPWCDCFVDWCFTKAYGASAAAELECGGSGDFYTPTSAQRYKNKGQYHRGADVKVGDQIFFKNSSRICHTGIVVGVSGSTITTIEGNTSGASGVIANGGGVCKKSYKIGYSSIDGYGRPNYGTQEGGYAVTLKEIKNGSQGNDVLLLQEIFRAREFDKKVIGESLALDRSFGAKTEKVVRQYQKERNLSVDGIVGNNTWHDLLGM